VVLRVAVHCSVVMCVAVNRLIMTVGLTNK